MIQTPFHDDFVTFFLIHNRQDTPPILLIPTFSSTVISLLTEDISGCSTLM